MYAHLIGFAIGIAPLFVASLVALRREGYAITWQSVGKRFRFRRMTGATWLWSAIVLLLAAVVTYGLFVPIQSAIVQGGWVTIPGIVPESLNPQSAVPPLEAYDRDVGGTVGNWWPFIILFVVNAFSVTSEEFWWRGVVLPRQEAALGRWAWVVHGVLWAPFHLFKYWAFIELFPITLGIAYVSSRFRNTTPAFIVHMVVNVLTGVAGTAILALGWVDK
jgi:membrane protease YdiL (CAAX protease family)